MASTGLFQIGRAAADVKNQMVDYKQGDTALQGYLAYDDKLTGKRPAVLIVHHRDGLDDFTKGRADMAAKLGYVAFACDIFGKGILPKNVKEAQEQSGIYNKNRPLMRARATAGLEVLQKHPMVDASKIATVGYCFGGTTVIELAHTGAPVVGTVTIHGSFRDFTPGAAQNIKGRVLILHGAEDPTAPLKEVDLVVAELRKTQVDWTLELFAGAHHGFSRPANAIEARANTRSVEAMNKFLGEVLKA
jgi:dienelactone hydrolase